MDDELRLPLVRRIIASFSERHWVALDIVVALLIGVSAIFTASNTTFRVSGPAWAVVRYGATAVAAAALPLRRRHPVGVLTVIGLAVGLAVSLQVEQSLVNLTALALYTVTAVSPRRTSQIALGVVVVAMWVAVTVDGTRVAGALFVTAVGIAAAWLAGENTRSRTVYAAAVSERAAEREAEREQRLQRAVADERVVIARELHDVVAHAMSVIAVRAGVARVVIDAQPDEARDALGIIETTARRALQEMRLLVGVLRHTDGVSDGELMPAPGLDRVVELVDQARHAGVEVAVEIDGEERPLPGGADLSAYRIIQEALTNVARHAGPTRAQLRIVYRSDEIVIEVIDEGGRNWDPPHPDPTGSGHGLIGMRERAALYGGDLVAGPHGHGFEVRATLPIREVSG